MTDSAHLANVLYIFAQYVESVAVSGLTDGLIERANEVQDLALKYIVEEFRDAV